jgi:hypothetical protein
MLQQGLEGLQQAQVQVPVAADTPGCWAPVLLLQLAGHGGDDAPAQSWPQVVCAQLLGLAAADAEGDLVVVSGSNSMSRMDTSAWPVIALGC